MTSFIAELKRRKVIRVAGLYVVTAWLLVQVAETLLPAFGAPGWVLRTLVVVLALGFVPVLVFSWAFELTPDGFRRDAAVDPAHRTESNRKLDIATLIVAVLAIGLLALDRLAPEGAPAATVATTVPANGGGDAAAIATGAATATPAASAAPKKSIAVLPFVNMSAEAENEYFSDGIAEELLNALAKVEDLKVAGRTSSFYYKGKDVPLPQIGRELGVAHVLEGSVRRQGEKVRITAQLIQVSDGYHLWSETYDGDLDDVFELQERIARQITDALGPVLDGAQQQRLVPVATTDPVAYSNFLQATAIFNRRERARFAEAITLLEEAIARDPAFARAHARLGAILAVSPEYIHADLDASHDAAEKSARRAIELDPGLAEAYTVIAYVIEAQGDLVAGREWYDRALAKDPNDVLSNFWGALGYVRAGYLDEGEKRVDRVLEIDPMLPNGLAWRGWLHVYRGQWEPARRVLDRALDLGLDNAHLPMALVEHAAGDDARARAEMEAGLRAFGAGMPPESPAILAAGKFGDEAARAAAVAHLRTLLERPGTVPGPVVFSLIWLDEPALAMDAIMSRKHSSQIWENSMWDPVRGAAIRRHPRFGELARKSGYAALWDRFGPPPNCRKQPDGDYTCE